MKQSDAAIPCQLTGPDGEVIWSGTIGSLREAARDLRAAGKKRELLADTLRRMHAAVKSEAPDAE